MYKYIRPRDVVNTYKATYKTKEMWNQKKREQLL